MDRRLHPMYALFGERGIRQFAASQMLELLGGWAQLVALLTLVFELSGEVAVVALFMLARLAPRAIVTILGVSLPSVTFGRQLLATSVARAPLAAGLMLVTATDDLRWAWIVVVLFGALAALSDVARTAMLPTLVPRMRIADANTLTSVVGRACVAGGALLAALVLAVADAAAVFAINALLLLGSALLLWQLVGDRLGDDQPHPVGSTPAGQPADRAAGRTAIRQLPRLRIMAGALFVGGIVAVSLQIALVAIVMERLDRSPAVVGLLFACVGLGMLSGPLPVPRLLLRLPASVVATAIAGTLAAGLAVVSQVDSLLVIAVILVLGGLLSVTSDQLATISARRLTPRTQADGVFSVLSIGVVLGQIVAAAGMAALTQVWSVTSVLLGAGMGCVLGLIVLFVLADGRTLLTTFQQRVFRRR